MITTGVVKKAAQQTCVRCGLKAASPMVVANGQTRGVEHTPLGVCSNMAACERRQRRTERHAPAKP